MKLLQSKKAVITGGSSGIGLSIAKAFAENGADVLIIGRNIERLENAKTELLEYENKVMRISHDLSKLDSMPILSRRIFDIFPDVDILVNNVGGAELMPFEDVSRSNLDYALDLNLKSPFLLTQFLLPSLKERKGNIINISSFHAQRAIPGYPATVYAMVKGAMNSFTRSLAYELGPCGVRVNAISPGGIGTQNVNAVSGRTSDSEFMKKMEDSIRSMYPLGRIGSADDLGGAAVYLASENASWVTGSILNIDGGLSTN
jgi:Dehydrogenases with different specificities (related to short-chain alcohol dehydrogenases)